MFRPPSAHRFVLALSAACLIAGQAVADGVAVSNPATPTGGETTIALTELWRLGGDTDNDDEFFGVLGQITSDDDGNVYLLDRQLNEVRVFDADGAFLTAMGREGEGPGEFRRPSDVFLTPDGHIAVMQGAPGKVVLFTKDGEAAGEMLMPQSEGGGFRFFGGGEMNGGQLVLSVMENKFDDASMTRTSSLIRVDDAGTETARYTSRTDHWDRSNTVFKEDESMGRGINYAVAPDGRVYASWGFHDYTLHVWNPDGSPDRTITREHSPRVRSAEEKEEVKARMGGFMRRMGDIEVVAADTDRAIADFYARNDGTLWVLTSEGAKDLPEGALGRFDVFDKEGTFTRQITLTGEGNHEDDGFFFAGNRLYVVLGLRSAQTAMRGGRGTTDDEPEELEEAAPIAVVCYKLRDTVGS